MRIKRLYEKRFKDERIDIIPLKSVQLRLQSKKRKKLNWVVSKALLAHFMLFYFVLLFFRLRLFCVFQYLYAAYFVKHMLPVVMRKPLKIIFVTEPSALWHTLAPSHSLIATWWYYLNSLNIKLFLPFLEFDAVTVVRCSCYCWMTHTFCLEKWSYTTTNTIAHSYADIEFKMFKMLVVSILIDTAFNVFII